jgi:lipopolysaccharide/colanic/teichoic acid biosynthesis glycosyltransferase
MYRSASERAHIEGAHAGGLEWRMRKHAGDPRITPIGRFLRRWSLDEFPQLINVFRGEMSLIGPRPIVEAETGLYGKFLSYYLAVTPGMSGLWQVSGRSEIGYARRAQLDALYVGTWSLRSDWAILYQTFPAVLSRRGAHWRTSCLAWPEPESSLVPRSWCRICSILPLRTI